MASLIRNKLVLINQIRRSASQFLPAIDLKNRLADPFREVKIFTD